MTIEQAVQECQAIGLRDWDLVTYAQTLINQSMRYSITNSLDSPAQALARGQGYCWHQAKVLNTILNELGISSHLVHAFRNWFPQVELEGQVVKNFITGHVWCRVTIDQLELDVCPGNAQHAPGLIMFKPLSKVRNWNKGMDYLTYYGAALVNYLLTIRYHR
jgi:hypothetical protein